MASEQARGIDFRRAVDRFLQCPGRAQMTLASLKVATHRAIKSLRKMLAKGGAER